MERVVVRDLAMGAVKATVVVPVAEVKEVEVVVAEVKEVEVDGLVILGTHQEEVDPIILQALLHLVDRALLLAEEVRSN